MPRRDENTGTAVLDRPVGEEPQANQNGTEAGATAAENQASQQEAAATATRAPKRNPDELGPDEIVGINVRMPNALRLKIAETAKAQNTSVPQLLASMVAEAYSFELPKPSRPARIKKYDTPEQRKEAQKAAQAKQRTTTRALLAAIEDGKLGDIDVEALVAEYAAKQAAAAAVAPEGGEATAGAAAS